ncbi:uncharacterized protein [Amphiura filiformis]|uniref:uncharacterized protein n=1 Tax=Amphiura filiformis TaxID=82378 RepID=UPI003B212AEA
MSGSGVGLNSKYHIDDAELERLREFSRSKMAFRTGSASSQRLRSRPSLTTPTSGFFVTQKDMGIDAVSGMVISGHQINSTAPSEAGKTVPTRSSSAVTDRTHGIGGQTGMNGDSGNETSGKDSGDVQSTHVNGNSQEVTETNGTVSPSTKPHQGAINNQTEGTDSDSKTDANQNLSNGDHSSDLSENKPSHNEQTGDVSNHGDTNGGNVSCHGDSSNHGGASNHGEDGTGDASDKVDGLMHAGKNGDGIGGNKDGHIRGGGGDGDGCHGDGGSGSGGDGDGDRDGDQNGQGNIEGEADDKTSEEVLHISLTEGITLISKSSGIIRNKDEIYMTNFDKPNIDRLRSEMEDIQRNNNLSSDDEDDDDEDATGDGCDGTDDAKRYHLNTRDSEISRMEEKLQKVKLLEADISSVGHLTESKEDLMELQKEEETAEKIAENVASGDYDTGIFAQAKNDEEMKEAEERRKEAEERRKEKQRLRSPYRPTVNGGNNETKKETKKPYRFQLSDIYKFINSRQRAIFEEKFEELDKDNNGKVTLKEIKQKMKSSNAPKEQIKKFMQVFDLNKDKTIDKREFVTVAALNDKLTGHETQSTAEPLRLDLDALSFNIQAYKEMFHVTDKNRDSRLNLEEIMLIVALSVGVDIGSDPEVVKHIHKTIDADDDGSIDFIEFLSYIPFFLKLHHQILGRPATIQEIEEARLAVRKAVLKVGVR